MEQLNIGNAAYGYSDDLHKCGYEIEHKIEIEYVE